MKNSKRMIAVVAASGLAMGTLPGVANAQSVEIGIGVGAVVGSVALGAALGSTGDVDSSGGASSLPGLDSDSLGTDSLGEGSSDLGSVTDSLGEGSSDLGSVTDSLGEGSSDLGSVTDSLGEGSSDLGSVTDSLGAGSLGDILGELTGSASGSGEGGGSDFGSGDIIVDGSGEGSLDAGTVLALGSLAAAGIGIGLAVSGGVNLPPLPEINVGLVCNLPQEGIDFLKNNGSMEQDECEPEEQN